ncbi:MAG: hypothetical protein O2909_10335 [Chloroflexi bacterium]|nr:hypothetical protein [Chloroflexota bacterium]MDA1219826.1 hypothetical protein [Chloroflexota bacterium]PKB57194.1 MAG: hypothetical protein BZY73_04400 [SAR202 cluster bacterium Casp-Chloro-G3]
MQIVRVYAGDDGESHLEDLTADQFSAVVNNVGNDEISLGLRVPGWSEGYHTAPRHQYVLFMEGGAEIEVASGEKRQFQPGDVLVAEDVTGHGHMFKNLGEGRRVSLAVPLKD